MRVTITDETGGEAFISMRDDACLKVFGITPSCMDVFKDYFF
jgi:hypothetical protein